MRRRTPINDVVFGVSNKQPIPINCNCEQKPFACPVCRGEGQKLYSKWLDGEQLVDENEIVQCHACNGQGIIWG